MVIGGEYKILYVRIAPSSLQSAFTLLPMYLLILPIALRCKEGQRSNIIKALITFMDGFYADRYQMDRKVKQKVTALRELKNCLR